MKKAKDIVEQAQDIIDRVRRGDMEVTQARTIGNLLKVQVKKIELELEHAKLTGRLQQGSADLPAFTRVAALHASAPPAGKKAVNGRARA